MRFRFPGRPAGSADPAPSAATASAAQRPGATAEPGAEVTTAPAPPEGRGPKMQRASRTPAIASAQFLLIAASPAPR